MDDQSPRSYRWKEACKCNAPWQNGISLRLTPQAAALHNPRCRHCGEEWKREGGHPELSPADPVKLAAAELLAALMAAPRDAATGEPDYTNQRLRRASAAYVAAREGR